MIHLFPIYREPARHVGEWHDWQIIVIRVHNSDGSVRYAAIGKDPQGLSAKDLTQYGPGDVHGEFCEEPVDAITDAMGLIDTELETAPCYG